MKWYKEDGNERLIGLEIHRIPFFKSYEDGPDPDVKYTDYYTYRKLPKPEM
ncbi:hypothetical protein [Clostridium thermarum]|uniref:hypothetical protein n=1 Tax=Clostridium thermarum TaxID=1716543 RepID=UPI0013D8D1CD|nr:hypothetical protein [Clostridium thermarum]